MPWNNVTNTYLSDASDSSESALEYTDHQPAVDGDPIAIWEWLMQFPRAIAERQAVVNGAVANNLVSWPPSNTWFTGSTGVDSYTISGDQISFSFTLPAGAWDIDCPHPPAYRWVDYLCFISDAEGYACVPATYKLVIDPATSGKFSGALIDSSKVVEMVITGETYTAGASTGILTGDAGPILDMVTAGILDSIDDLIGAPWCIIDANGVYASDRLPSKPLQRQKWSGSATIGKHSNYPHESSSSSSDDAYSVLYDADATWETGQWTGCDLLFWDTRLKRVSIEHNDGQRCYFARDNYDVESTTYVICEAGNITYPGAPEHIPLQWYYGAAQQVFSHSVTDNPELAGCVLALPNVYLLFDGEDPCDHLEPVSVFDIPDAYYDDDSCYCFQYGQFFSPQAWKSIRSWQVEILKLCTAFVPVGDYTTATFIPLYVPPTLMASLGFNGGSSTVAIASGNMTFSVTGYDGTPLDYAISNPDGTYISGSVTPASGLATCGADTTPTHAGAAVAYTAGNTRVYKQRVKYLYDSPDVWIPDTSIDPDTGRISVIDPPAPTLDPETETYDCNGVGTFIRRTKSTASALYDTTGQLVDNAGAAFITDTLYTHEGDNQDSSPITPQTAYGDLTLSPKVIYFDRCFRGTYGPDLQQQREESEGGSRLIGSTKYSITTLEHWYDDGVNPGVMRTEASTATSGNATSLTDTSRNTADNTLPWGCYYSPDRFNFGLPYVDFILEVDKVTTGSDLVFDLAEPQQVSSASHSFSDNEVGGTLVITSAGAWTGGSYTIKSVSSGAANLNMAPATASATAGAWQLTTTYKMPIKAPFVDHHGTGGITINFAAVDGFTVAAGDAWRISETYIGNKWRGRELKLTATDGTVTRLPIEFSDDSSLLFAAQSDVIPITSSWEIIERSYGSVWKYDGSTFVAAPAPSSSESSSDTDEESYNSEDEQTWQHKVEPTYVKFYGPARCGDLPGKWLFDEMRAEIDALLWTALSYGWTAIPDVPTGGTTPDQNTFSYDAAELGGLNVFDWPNDGGGSEWSEGFWTGTILPQLVPPSGGAVDSFSTGSSDTAPFVAIAQNNSKSNLLDSNQGGVRASGSAAYAYGLATGIPTVFDSDVDFYAYATWGDGITADVETDTGYVALFDVSDLGDTVTAVNFDSFGTGLSFNQLYLFETVGGNTAARETDALGVNPPNSIPIDVIQEAANPPDNTDANTYTSIVNQNLGFRVTKWMAVARWDGDGGFTYKA